MAPAPPGTSVEKTHRPHRVLGRYALYEEIAAGGMAVVHFGRLVGPVGFARSVAIKRLHPQYVRDPEFAGMFLDEARLAARIRHPNVVPTLDVVSLEGELFLVMEYVQGETLSRLTRAAAQQKQRVPPAVAIGIMTGVLHGLQAAHEARSEQGQPLDIIHRDVSPQNILVGEDGVARIADFGIAKASWRVQSTREGQFKGKLPYMAPEQIRRQRMDRRVDVYAAGVVLWELLAGRRLVDADNPAAMVDQVMRQTVAPPSRLTGAAPSALDTVVLRALARDAASRFPTARAMAIALEEIAKVATAREIGDWVSATAGETLRRRAEILGAIEHGGDDGDDAGDRDGDDTVRGTDTIVTSTEVRSVEPRTLTTNSSLFSSIRRNASSWRARVPAGAALVIVGVAVVGVVLFARRGGTQARPAAATGVATLAAPPATIAPLAPATILPTGAPPEVAAPSDSTPGAPPPQSAATPALPHPPARWIPAATATAKPKPDCNPAFTVDHDGVRIPKPGCY
jgi:serine/threonine protein kinase